MTTRRGPGLRTLLAERDARIAELERREAATQKVLALIGATAVDPRAALDAIVVRAAVACGAADAALWLVDGDHARLTAVHGDDIPHGEVGSHTFRLDEDHLVPTSIVERRTVHIADALATGGTRARATAERTGVRTYLATPLMREGAAVGALSIRRRGVDPFTDEQVRLLEAFAVQAAIAIENARLFSELNQRNGNLREALDQQTATADVLRAIAASPTDLDSVLDAIAGTAARLCGAEQTYVIRVRADGSLAIAASGGSRAGGRGSPVGMDTAPGRVVQTGATVHVPDTMAAEALSLDFRINYREDARSLLTVPVLRDGRAIGVLHLRRTEAHAFTPEHVRLLETFADQAVIAIENARLFNELQERNVALTVALTQQTATAEVLQTISRSAFDLQPVLDTLAENAGRLTGANLGAIFRADGGRLLLAAHSGGSEELIRLVRENPPPIDRGTITGRAASERRPIRVDDVTADLEYRRFDFQRAEGYRSFLAVPLLRQDELLGVVSVWKNRVEPFTDRQLDLIQTFADQAVIAIENTRLFHELREQLERQTATSEVLRIISSSPTDLAPVLEALVANATRLLGASNGLIFRREGDVYRMAAQDGGPAALHELFDRNPIRPGRGSVVGRLALERRPVHLADVLADPEYSFPVQAAMHYRTVLGVPLLRAGEPVGAIVMWRTEVAPFAERQIELLQTFADQAVIAIENTRLFSELQERTRELARSVEQLTALGEVSRTVSSTLDLQAVLGTVVAHATELSGSDGGALHELDPTSQRLHLRATRSFHEELVAALRATPLRLGEGASGQAAATRAPVMIPDITAPGAYESGLRAIMVEAGVRAVLAIPLVREDEVVGTLVLTRNTPGDYPVGTVELVQTFATQSALAIQNARLFQELAEKSRQLEEASRHKSEFLANMSHELRTPLNAIIGFTEVLLEQYFGQVNAKQEDYLKDVLSSGQHLLALINDILDLSKVEAGRMELELGTFDLGHVLEAGLVMVKERASKKGIELVLELPEEPGRIEADERKVKQVVFNLLTNAVKFTPEGGTVTVSARRHDGSVEVAVADTGVGIAAEDVGTVFEEFGQARNQRGQTEGTGLGLALVKRFVELHGGTVRLESEVGRGSTFTFSLPVRGASAT